MKQAIMIHLASILLLVDHLVAVRTSRVIVLNAGNAKVQLSPSAGDSGMTWLNASWRDNLQASPHQDYFEHSMAVFSPLSPGFHYHPEDAFFDAVVQSLGVKSEEPCVEAVGEAQVGCLANCQCSWGRQCYPKFVEVSDEALELLKLQVSPRPRINIGVCQTSMPMLCVLSVLCFLCFLMCIVSVRTYLRLKEGEDMPMQVGVVQPTKLTCPLRPPAADGTLTLTYTPAPGKVVVGQTVPVAAPKETVLEEPVPEAPAPEAPVPEATNQETPEAASQEDDGADKSSPVSDNAGDAAAQ